MRVIEAKNIKIHFSTKGLESDLFLVICAMIKMQLKRSDIPQPVSEKMGRLYTSLIQLPDERSIDRWLYEAKHNQHDQEPEIVTLLASLGQKLAEYSPPVTLDKNTRPKRPSLFKSVENVALKEHLISPQVKNKEEDEEEESPPGDYVPPSLKS